MVKKKPVEPPRPPFLSIAATGGSCTNATAIAKIIPLGRPRPNHPTTFAVHAVVAQWYRLYRVKKGDEERTYPLPATCGLQIVTPSGLKPKAYDFALLDWEDYFRLCWVFTAARNDIYTPWVEEMQTERSLAHCIKNEMQNVIAAFFCLLHAQNIAACLLVSTVRPCSHRCWLVSEQCVQQAFGKHF